jgi:carbon-monoxide dehydrogenase large subunit
MIGDRLHVASNTQGVLVVKNNIIQLLGLEPVNVRVTTPDVGGGFGMKAMSYPEPVLVGYGAKVLNQAVRWTSGRLIGLKHCSLIMALAIWIMMFQWHLIKIIS